ncbi:MAG TPA: hypothetical protein VN902_23320 [Candidatus Acidoferrales bacterium]|nr:hypothetical protein [Candidatus Acidoferrales bacterium]
MALEARLVSVARPLQEHRGLSALMQQQAALPREAWQRVVPQLISLHLVQQGSQGPAVWLQWARQGQQERLESRVWKE